MVKDMAGLLQKQMENFVLAAAFEYAGKPNLVLMYSQDLVAKGKNAGKDVREAAKSILGGGGGQPGLSRWQGCCWLERRPRKTCRAGYSITGYT